jgi:hypothetical protein
VIQEIVDRSGWTSGNSLALVITGTGERVAESYDGKPSGARLLHVVFGPEGGATTTTTTTTNPPTTITAPSTTTTTSTTTVAAHTG